MFIFSSSFYISPVEKQLLAKTREEATTLKQKYQDMTALIKANVNSWFGRSYLNSLGASEQKCQELFQEAKQKHKDAARLERQIQSSCKWRRVFNLIAIGTMSYGAYKLGTNPWFLERCKACFDAVYGAAAQAAAAARQAADEQARNLCHANYGTPGANPSGATSGPGTPPPTDTPNCPPCSTPYSTAPSAANVCPPCQK